MTMLNGSSGSKTYLEIGSNVSIDLDEDAQEMFQCGNS